MLVFHVEIGSNKLIVVGMYTLKVGNGDGVPVLDFLSGGVGAVFVLFAMMLLESPAPSNALYMHRRTN